MLPLPIAQVDLQHVIIRPALKLLPPVMRGSHVVPLMAAMAAHASGLALRQQHGHGTGHGLWAMHRGHVLTVLHHADTAAAAREMCNTFTVLQTSLAVWRSLPLNDHLAACVARLLLWTHPRPLLAPGDAAAAWAYVTAVWQPDPPRPEAWARHYAAALAAFQRGQDHEPFF